MNAIEKLTKERSESSSDYERKVADALIKRCRESNALSADVMKQGKTLNECFSYIRSQAHKQAKNGCAVIEDTQVYEWAEDYYHSAEEPKKEVQKSEPKAEKKAQVVKFDKNKAIAKATASKPTVANNTTVSTKPVLDMNKPAAPKPIPKPTPKTPAKTPEYKTDASGQMSLFGLPF